MYDLILGGRIKGKSSCNDLCYGGLSSENALGAVLNPCDVTRSAGGSSSGSAALVSVLYVMWLECATGNIGERHDAYCNSLFFLPEHLKGNRN